MAIKKTKVEVYGETSKYERSMRNVKRISKSTSQSISSRWSKVFGTLGKLSAMFGVAGAAGFVVLGKNAIEAGDLIHKLNLRLGLSTESLSQLQHAANLSGVEFNTVAKSFQKMQENISDAGQGIGEAKNALEQIGLDARQLQLLSPERQLETIADALLEVDNQSDKVRIAADIFGSRGVQMLQLMHEGSAGIKEMREEADKLGITLSQEAAQSMADTNDAMTRVKTSISGVTRTMVIELAPAITEVANDMAAWIAQNRELIGQGTHEAIDKIKNSVQGIVYIYNTLPKGIIGAAGVGIIGRILTGSTPFGALIGFLMLLNKNLDKLPENLRSLNDEMRAMEKTGLEQMGMPPEVRGMFGGGSPSGHGASGGFGVPDAGPSAPTPMPHGEAESYQQLTDELLGLSQLRTDQLLELEYIRADLLNEITGQGTTRRIELNQYEHDSALQLAQDRVYQEIELEQQLEDQKKMIRMAGLNLLSATGEAMINITTKQGKAQFAMQKSLQVGMAVMSAFLAKNMALAHPPGPPSTIPLAAVVLKTGLYGAAAIAAASIGQMAAGAGGGGGGGGTIATPTYPAYTPKYYGEQTRGQLIINIEGDMIGDEGYIEMLAEKISEAVEDRDVRFVASDAKRADEVI